MPPVAREDSDRRPIALLDVDGTLYPNGGALEAAIERRVTELVAHFLDLSEEEALERRRSEFPALGGVFRGLLDRHGVRPEAYFEFLCGDETDPRRILEPDPVLRAVLTRCRARLFLFSNAPLIHCERVAEALEVRDLFEGIFEISQGGWVGKPDPPLYERALARLGVEGARLTAVDDLLSALDTAARYGMRTVYIGGDGPPANPPHVTIPSLHRLESGAPWLFD